MAVRFAPISTFSHQRPANTADDMHATERRWFAVRTSSKHEKMAVRDLQRLGVEAWIPLREKVYNYTSKKVTRELPLLPGYVFVRVCRAEENTVRFSHYVSRFIRLGDTRKQVMPAEIELLQRLSTDRQLDWAAVEEVFDFTKGTPVEIIRGPLAGIRGVYLEKKNKKTFVISLGGTGACLSTCEIDPTLLVALNGESVAEERASSAPEEQKALW